MTSIKTLMGRNRGGAAFGRQVQLGAGPQFFSGEKTLELQDPTEFRRVLLPLPELLTSSGVGGAMTALPQDIYQVDWLSIAPVLVNYNLTSTTLPATQLDQSADFYLEDIRVGTTPQLLATGRLPISMFREWSQIPDFVFDAGQTSKQFELRFGNVGTLAVTLRAGATALKAI